MCVCVCVFSAARLFLVHKTMGVFLQSSHCGLFSLGTAAQTFVSICCILKAEQSGNCELKNMKHRSTPTNTRTKRGKKFQKQHETSANDWDSLEWVPGACGTGKCAKGGAAGGGPPNAPFEPRNAKF